MKRNALLILMLLPALLLGGCKKAGGEAAENPSASQSASAPQNPSDPSPSASQTPSDSSPSASATPALATAADYFPILKNVKYSYEGEGNEYASYDVYIDYTSDGKVQLRSNNGGTETVRVYEIGGGKVTQVFSRSEVYYRENFLGKTEGEPEVLIMEPIAAGTTWTLPDGRVRTIRNTSARVETPSGTYDALEISTESAADTTTDYYAKGVGPVKSVFSSGDAVISSTLGLVEKDAAFVQRIRFFYPGADAEKIYFKDADVSFKTDDITRELLAEAYKKTAEDGLGTVFSADAEIRSLYLNDDGMVYMDMNRAFLDDMNAGSGYESMILQSLADTVCRYYGTDRLILTVENGLYESGHIALGKGEYLTADPDSAVEFGK